jgi:glycerophosphoryl diester phosphodiesterase
MYFTLRKAFQAAIFLILVSCSGKAPVNDQAETNMQSSKTIDFQGHRGCRGLLPENTIPGFLKALDLGVTTLEMDVVITADKKVILSHEPWFSHEICLDPQGNEISEDDERNHNIYKLTYAETQRYDCGSKVHPRFLQQQKMHATKPLLADVILAAEAHAVAAKRPLPFYNIETKSLPERDEIFHPGPEEFSSLLADVIITSGISDRAIIQSFDVRTLQALRRSNPDIALALLIENNLTPEANLDLLGFIPEIYSPDYALVDEELVAFCKSKDMKLIPWTVNDAAEMKKLISMGVDGIISDYPDKFALLR